MSICIRAAQSSRDRDAIYRLRAAAGRSVSMSPPAPAAVVERVFELADTWPETVLLLVESEERCLGCARVDGARVDVVMSEEGAWIEPALRRSIADLDAPMVLPTPIRVLYAPGERIFSAMETAASLMVIQQGTASYCGSELALGERLGESAVVPGGLRFSDAVAGPSGAEIGVLPAATLHALMAAEPMLRMQLTMALSERMAGLVAEGVRAKMTA